MVSQRWAVYEVAETLLCKLQPKGCGQKPGSVYEDLSPRTDDGRYHKNKENEMLQKEMVVIFDQVEELTGQYPTFADLQNAVHAVITKSFGKATSPAHFNGKFGASWIINNVASIAKQYAYQRPILVEGHHLRLNPQYTGLIQNRPSY